LRKKELNPAIFPGLILNCKEEDLLKDLWAIAEKTRGNRVSLFSRSS